MDPSSGQVTWSPELFDLMGLDSKSTQVTAEFWSKIMTEDSFFLFKKATVRAVEKNMPFELEVEVVLTDGRHIWLRSYGQMETVENGSRLFGVFQDITRDRLIRRNLTTLNERLQFILEGANLGTWDYDLQNQDVRLDRRLCEILGVDLEDAPKKMETFQNLIHPDDLPTVQHVLNSHLKGDNLYFECVHRMKQQSGKWVWIIDRGKVSAFDDSGKPTRFSGTFLDITQTKEIEESLYRHQQFLSSILDNSPSVVSVKGKNGRYILVNNQFEKIVNRRKEQILGKMDSDIFPVLLAAQFYKTDIDILQGKDPVNIEEQIIVNGEERDFITVKFPLFDVNHQAYAVCRISTDITEQKRMEHDLRQQQIALSESAAVAMIDTEGSVTFVNDNLITLCGYENEPIIGSDLNIFRSQHHHLDFYKKMWEQVLNGMVWRGEIKSTYKNGREYWVDATLVPVRDLNDRIVKFVVILYDITAKKNAEEELIRSREAAIAGTASKSEFVANMSHEIRTPMNAIIGVAELLAETSLSDEQKKYVSVLLRSSQGLLELINNILDLSKIESGQIEFESIDFNVRDMVEKVREMMSVVAKEKAINFEINYDYQLGDIFLGDPSRVRQIIINLVGNAVKFTNHGKITIGIQKATDNAKGFVLSVTDSGIGMTEDQMSKLFERFTQADSSITKKYGGTGLGLSISKELAEKMGGRIWVESTVNVGSTFSCYLPLQSADKKLTPVRVRSDLSGIPIIFFDENPVSRFVGHEALARWGCKVRDLPSIEMLSEEINKGIEGQAPYQLIIIDYKKHSDQILSVMRSIRNQYKNKCPRIIVQTIDGEENLSLQLKEAGADQVVIKPVKQADLKEIILRLVNQVNFAQPAAPINIVEDKLQPINLLLVDDNEDNRMLVKSYLKKYDIKITEADNGQVAYDTFIKGDFDLCFMDIQMPVMDGYTATAIIRSWEKNSGRKRVPIVALTAFGMKEEKERSFESGCDYHLVKPIKKHELIKFLFEIQQRKQAA